jgi:hypothetical protein
MNTDTSLAPDAGDDVDADANAVSAAADSITPPASWPMLYRRPVVLSSQLHAHWRVRQTGAAFAAGSHSIPVMIGEFAAASRAYPLVFAGPEHLPIAVLGLEAEQNRFVNADQWQAGAYIPAYVRRYPFVFARTTDPDGYVLAIDADADMIVQEGEEGQPLFEGDQPSAMTRHALQFCEAFTREDIATRAFSAALAEAGVLIERQADVVLADGRRPSQQGLHLVHPPRLDALPDATFVHWHRQGWLAPVYFHLASLGRFADLATG